MALLLASRLRSASVLKNRIIVINRQPKIYRKFTEDGKEAFTKATKRRQANLKEKLMEPEEGSAFNFGKGAVAGASIIGIGALCFYGLGLGHETGALEKHHLWPQYVKDRIKATYTYFGGSLIVTALSALQASKSPTLMRFVMANGFLGLAISLAAIIGTGVIVQSIPYQKGFGIKQLAWIAHTATMGAMIAPMCFLGGPVLIRAAWYTAGIVGGLSTIAVCAPSEKFMNIGGPLAMGLGVVFASSIGSVFLPPTTALGAGLYSVTLYGGLLLFSGFLLYDTQRVIAQAERYPEHPDAYGARPYDPINACIGIYLDTINLFIRIATILAGGGQGRK